MMPALTDFLALAGIDLVLCACTLGLLCRETKAARWLRWLLAAMFFALWWPLGPTGLPVVAFVRGVSSDPSVTLIVLSSMSLWQRLSGTRYISRREISMVYACVVAAGLLLYPLALGAGGWDAYRPGWGSVGMWAALLMIAATAWLGKFMLLPLMLALGLLFWTAGMLESNNLWDYLLDPWMFSFALFCSARAVITGLQKRSARAAGDGARSTGGS